MHVVGMIPLSGVRTVLLPGTFSRLETEHRLSALDPDSCARGKTLGVILTLSQHEFLTFAKSRNVGKLDAYIEPGTCLKEAPWIS